MQGTSTARELCSPQQSLQSAGHQVWLPVNQRAAYHLAQGKPLLYILNSESARCHIVSIELALWCIGAAESIEECSSPAQLFIICTGTELVGLQGPVAEIRLQEISLGSSQHLAELVQHAWQAAASLQLSLPLHIQGVQLVLRTKPASNELQHQQQQQQQQQLPQPLPPEDQAQPPAAERKAARKEASVLKRLAVRLGTQLVFSVTPAVPIHVQQVTVQLQVCSRRLLPHLMSSCKPVPEEQSSGCAGS